MPRTLMAGLVAAAFGLLAIGLFGASPAQAFPDAQIDAQIRPCFGGLTDPTIGTRCRAKPRSHRSTEPKPLKPPPTYIDCAYARPGEISQAIAGNYDGVTITLTSTTGQACRESVAINRPARIEADPNVMLRFGQPLLVAPSGQPCLRLAPRIWVAIRGLSIGQAEGERAPCIQGQDVDLTVIESDIAYSGDGSAITLVGDSRLNLVGSQIVSRSLEPAVVLQGRLKLDTVTIGAAVAGLKVTTTEDSSMRNLTLVRLDDWTGSRRSASSAGLVVADVGANQLIDIQGLAVTGFSRGVYVSGAGEINLRSPRINGADWALIVEGPSTRVSQASLQAGEVGLYAASGTTFISRSEIKGVMRSGIYAERGAQVRSVDNVVYAAKSGCAALKTGFFEGALTCRPWFEAAALGGSAEDPTLPTYDSLRSSLDQDADEAASAANEPPPLAGGPAAKSTPPAGPKGGPSK